MLQGDLEAATDAPAQAEALAAFLQALVEAYTEAGVSVEAQAKARQSGRTALLKFFSATSVEARFALMQQAEILMSLATTRAIEATFEAEGASQNRLDALAQARTTLLAALYAASSENESKQAHAAYEASVETEVMAELNISEALLVTVEAVLATEKATLEAAVASVNSADAVAEAFTLFYPSAEASVESTLAAHAKAGLAARVLTLMSLL